MGAAQQAVKAFPRREQSTATQPATLAVDRTLGAFASLLVVLYGSVLILKPDNLFADDSYFYLQVAWNFARGMGSTFNQVMPTNGYHPLWMLVCAAVFRVVPERGLAIHAVAGVITLLDVLMLLTVWRTLRTVGGDLWPVALGVLVPFSFLSQLGTEGALSGCMLALLMFTGLRLVRGPGLHEAFWFNLVGALAVLSRLDNIFIVGFVWIEVGWQLRGRARLLQLKTLPIYAVLWGAYLATNRVYFGLWQPISGMLKSNSPVDHRLGANLPHSALAALAVILVCGAALAVWRCDLFFRTIELPVAAGVLCHALYITFRMSSETRWSWYYTSWVLLAAVMLARVVALLIEHRRELAAPVGAVCLALLAVLWLRVSYQHVYRGPDRITPASFNQQVYKLAGIHRALAYDQPGRLAYYSDVEIIPLDGLMGNLNFQANLTRLGAAGYVAANQIDGFIGPPVPLANSTYQAMCEQVYLSSVSFDCKPASGGGYDVSGVKLYARVPAASAGRLRLSDDQIVWQKPDSVAVWRLTR